MSCLTKQMKLEAIALERVRLQELDDLGYETEDAYAQLDAAEKALGDLQKVKTSVMPNRLSASEIARINAEQPKYKGSVVRVVDGYSSGTDVKLQVNFGKSDKVYTYDSDLISLNQSDVKSMVLFATPRGVKDTTGRNVLAKTDINNTEKVLQLFDDLGKIDEVETTTEHASKLRTVIQQVVSPVIRAIPEMGVYLHEKAQRNNGFINLTDGQFGIYLASGVQAKMYGNEMSLQETFTHELVHAAVYWAMNTKGSKSDATMNRLIDLHKVAMSQVTVEDLLPDVSVNAEVELAVAKETLKYLDSSLDEFVAYAMSNEKLMKKLETIDVKALKAEPKGFIDKLMYHIEQLVDMAMMKWRHEPKDMKADQLMVKLVGELLKINNTVNEVREKSKLDIVDDFIDELEDKVRNKLDEWQAKTMKTAIQPQPIGESKMKNVAWALANMGHLLFNPQMAPMLRTLLSDLGLKQEGTVQNMIQKTRSTDELQDVVEELGLASLQVDRNRETTALAMAKVVSSAFSKLDKKQKKTLYHSMLTMDGALLVHNYENAVELYEDATKRTAEIDRIANELSSILTVEEMRFVEYQINGLVNYMQTGLGSIVQLKNATAIAMFAGTDKVRRSADKDLVKKIDTLVSLKAVDKLEESVRGETVELLKNETDGMKALAAVQNGFNEYVDEQGYAEEKMNRRKGYKRETYDKYITSTIAPLGMKSEMEKKGYELVETLRKTDLHYDKTTMGLYVSKHMIQQPFNKAVVRYVGNKQQGRTLWENYAKQDVAVSTENTKSDVKQARSRVRVMNDQIMSGQEVNDNMAISPVLSASGRIMDFRYNVEEVHKVKHLGMSMSVTEAIGRSWAHRIDEEESKAINQMAWQEMLSDMAKNYRGGTYGVSGDEYLAIDIDSSNDVVRDIVRILPKEFHTQLRLLKQVREAKTEVDDALAKEIVGDSAWDELTSLQKRALKKQLTRGKVVIRRDMLHKMFGFRDLSLVDAKMLQELPKALKTAIKIAENGWKEFVAMYKVNVVIKTLSVPVTNVVTNFMYVMTDGFSPMSVAKAQLEGWRGLNKWIKDDYRIKELTGLIHANPDNEGYRREFRQLDAEMKGNPIKPLVDAGLYQHIMEDLSSDEFSSSSRFANYIDEKTENWPELVKIGIDYMFVTEKTGLFRAMQKFTMFGDFVARHAQYQLTLEKSLKKFAEKNGREMTKEELEKYKAGLTKDVTRNFINYSDPDSPVWQYVQDMGLAAFTKYGIGIQRVIKEQAYRHPIRFALSVATHEGMQGALDWTPEIVAESSVFAGHTLFTPGPSGIIGQMLDNAIPIYGNVDRALR